MLDIVKQVHTKRDSFVLHSKDHGDITIDFVDGKFAKYRVHLSSCWRRDEWKLLAEIEKEITRLEKEMK